MDNTTELLSEFQKTKAAYDTLVKEKGRALLDGIFRQMFAACPSVLKIGWHQYTPHFNDGDACEFSVRDRHVLLVGPEPEEDEGGIYDWPEIHYGDWPGVDASEHNRVKALDSALDRLEDVMQSAFGDHARVFASRAADGGVVFEVEEYSHD